MVHKKNEVYKEFMYFIFSQTMGSIWRVSCMGEKVAGWRSTVVCLGPLGGLLRDLLESLLGIG